MKKLYFGDNLDILREHIDDNELEKLFLEELQHYGEKWYNVKKG